MLRGARLAITFVLGAFFFVSSVLEIPKVFPILGFPDDGFVPGVGFHYIFVQQLF